MHQSHIPQYTIFVIEMCIFVLQGGVLWDICQMHCGICEMGLTLPVNSVRPSDAYKRKLSILGSDNGLSPGRRQAII